jgi:hypothetical protein
MICIFIAGLEVKLNLVDYSSSTGAVFEGRRGSANILVVVPPEGTRFGVITTSDREESSYLFKETNGYDLTTNEGLFVFSTNNFHFYGNLDAFMARLEAS